MALELVQDLSAKSWVSQRLWRTVKSLKAYAPRVGLQQDEDPRMREHAALTMAGMAASGHNHGGMSSASTHRSSVSSGGHQPTPSPGLTPGYSGQQRPLSRMESLTPHAGRDSPRPAGVGQTLPQNQQGPQVDDQTNGLRLRTEMSRMYESFTNGGGHGSQFHNGADDFFGGHMVDYAAAGANHGQDGNVQIFPHLKEMF